MVTRLNNFGFSNPDEEPDFDDSVKYCPDCERPNQFGEMCPECIRERQMVARGDDIPDEIY